MAASYNACSKPLSLSASNQPTASVFLPSHHSGPVFSTPTSPYSTPYGLNYTPHFEQVNMDSTSLVQTYLSSPVPPPSAYPTFHPASPQPSLYQVPAFCRSASPVNGYHGNMSKFGGTTGGLSPNSASPALPSPSFSFSSRNYRNGVNHTGDLNHSRLAIGPPRKSSHYVSGRANKADILLDRKAFISLEKSINWQSLLSETPSPCTSSSPTPSTGHHTAACSGAHSPRPPCHLSSPQLSPVTSPVNDVSQGKLSDSNWSQTNGERDFTLPGMKDVPAWLKLLRLHKYAPFFARMSYEEMLELTEDVLEHRNITKGARQKLILSIQKLKARSAVLLASEQELLDIDRRQYQSRVSYSGLSQVLFQIRAFLSTPIRPLSASSLLRVSSSCPSVSCSSLCSTCSGSPSPPSSFLSSIQVDFNNNSNHGGCQLSGHKELLRCWSLLSNDELPDIMSRLIGHVHYILVEKCKKRLKKLKLWQEHFKDIHDKLSPANSPVSLPERDVYERYPSLDNDHMHSNYSDREENDDDEDSGLLDFDAVGIMGGEASSPSSTPNGTDKDSGVDEAAGDSDNGDSLDGDILTAEEEEELYMVLRSVLDKCLSHEAFWPHQAMYRHWRQQLQCMISGLRTIVADCTAAIRSGSPFTAKNHHPTPNDYCYSSGRSAHLTGQCTSPIPPVQHKVATFPSSCKKPSSSANSCQYPKSNSSPAYAPSLSAGRRLLHNRLRSSISSGTALTFATTTVSSMHRNGTGTNQSTSPPEETTRSTHYDRRTSCFKSSQTGKTSDPGHNSSNTNGSSSQYCFPGTTAHYSNLSVIPRLSTLFPSPITLNLNPNATAFTGNSPEANLRNLLLQQLLTTQQQQQQQQHSSMATAPKCSPACAMTDSPCALSPDRVLSGTPPHLTSLINSPPIESIDSYSPASNCGQSADDNQVGTSVGEQQQQQYKQHFYHQQTPYLDNNSECNPWSLSNGNLDAKKVDWNATGLLSSLDYYPTTGKLEDMLNLLDNSLDMSLTIGWPSSCPATETITSLDDIEKLCIRMAEHALDLDISDDSIYS